MSTITPTRPHADSRTHTASAERLDADVWRRRAQAWPEYEAELLAEADRAVHQQTAA